MNSRVHSGKLRVLHHSDALYPIVKGGTEIFIRRLMLAQMQSSRPLEILWSAHSKYKSNQASISHENSGLNQILLPQVPEGSRFSRFSCNPLAIPGFYNLLNSFNPDVVHLHNFTETSGLSHAIAAKEYGAKLVFTMHVPICSCNGNFNYFDLRLCNGSLDSRVCTFLRLQSAGLPKWLAFIISYQYGWPLSVENKNKVAKLITARQITKARHQSWMRMTELVDEIHVLAGWCQDFLLNQGLPRNKIHLIRTAGPNDSLEHSRKPMSDGILRLVYWGRCHSSKGLELVIKAIRAMPIDSPIQLDFYGQSWDNSDYQKTMYSLIKGNSHFRFMGVIPNDKLLITLKDYDLAVVPSTWLETGPLTVLEAFAAGLPVAGSSMGGIKELLTDVKGCFLLPLEINAWKDLFVNLIKSTEELKAAQIPKPRSFQEIVKELNNKVY